MPRYQPVRARRDGRYDIDLAPTERALIRSAVDQLRDLLVQTDGPVLRRLFPPPYGDDDERNEGWAALARPELVENRLATLERVTASIDADTLGEDDLAAWMRSINDVRLVLGTVLDIVDDDTDVVVDENNAATFQAYEVLGIVLESIVAARTELL